MNELAKYKICPACNEHNPPWLLECRACETDLTAIKLTDGAATPSVQEAINTPDLPPELVRLCDCGAANIPQLRKCAACGEDISDIQPVPCPVSQTPACMLVSPEGREFPLSNGEYLLGRGETLREYLEEKNFVSRRHAKLNLCEGELYLENLSATNPTFVNNQRIPDHTPVRLQNNDEFSLGGKRINGKPQALAAYFVVRLHP